MSNAAINYEKQNELNNVRTKQQESAPLNVPRNNDYLKNSTADYYNETNNVEGNHASRLDAARERMAKSETEKAKNLAEDALSLATPMGAFSLLKQMNLLTDMPYVAAMGAALAKDLITIATFETVILPIVFSVLCSIFIFMMLLLVGGSGKRKGANALLKKTLFLLGGGIFGSIPGLDIFPFETLTVVVIYYMELSERKHAHD